MGKSIYGLVICQLAWMLMSCDDPVKIQDSCGDDFLDPGERCDTNQLNGVTCLNSGYHDEDGVLRCTAACEYDYSGCGEARCGDAIIQGEHEEQCEGGDLGGNSCVTLGYFRGTLACTASCRYDLTDCEAGGFCGDAVVQEGDEQCDGNELGGATCESLGRYGGELTCDDGCQFDLSTCAGRCGDGEVDGAYQEECDGANLDGETCVNLGFSSGELTCDACRLVTDACVPYCGDGALQPEQAEECEGTLFGGHTCRTRGWIFGGELACDDGCRFDEAPCRSIVQIATGGEFTCALLSDGTAACWGANGWGQCGDGLTTYLPQNLPNPVAGISNATRLHTGFLHACALLSDGTVRCWGMNQYNQLGNGSGSPMYTGTAVSVTGVTGAIGLGGGAYHTCAILVDGTLRCWGVNHEGQLGIGAAGGTFHTPVIPIAVTNATAVVGGDNHTCALLSDGSAKCFGDGAKGQIGDGYNTDDATPVPVYGLTTAVALAAGQDHTCALLANGQVHCWGEGYYGALGSGGTSPAWQPYSVPGMFGVIAISAGGRNSCAVFNDQSVQCWGYNNRGQVGDGTTDQANSPVVIPGLAGTVMLENGNEHGCAVLDGGRRAMCWGNNGSGRLGDGTTTQRLSPTPVLVP